MRLKYHHRPLCKFSSNPKVIATHYLNLENCTNHLHPNHFNQILAHAIVSGLFLDPFFSSKLLLHSLFHNHITFSHTLFSQIQNPNIFAWNFMCRAYSHSSSPEETVKIYNLMRHNNILPDNYTFPFILKACGRLSSLSKGRELHGSSLVLGLELDVFIQNALISMYSFSGMVETARKVFNMVPIFIRDIVSWNSIVSGYLQNDLCTETLNVFRQLLGDSGSVRPNEVTMLTAITACGRIGCFHLGRKIHGLVVVSGFDLDVFLGSSLIDMYGKCGRIEDARKVFERIPQRNVVCWTSLIAGYVLSNLFKEAIEVFREMQISGIGADSPTIVCVVSACGHLGALDYGRWVHSFCERSGIEMNLTICNSLIDMYSKCGDIGRAFEIFCGLFQRDVFSWTVMISGLAMNGESEKALHLFSQMEMSSDVRPNTVTFLGVLSACSHGGFVDEGFHYFKAMTETYDLTPQIEHYGCMVDLLGRANLLVEAEKFITTMPTRPDVVIWRSLLFVCRNHGNVELAEFAANKIEEMDPKRCGARVLLSNTYARASMWNDVKRVRKGMAARGIQKQPGCSFVEVNGIVREFFVADKSHEEMNIVYEMIAGINNVIQSKDPG